MGDFSGGRMAVWGINRGCREMVEVVCVDVSVCEWLW